MTDRPPRSTRRRPAVPAGLLSTGVAFFLSLGLGLLVVEGFGVVRLSDSALATVAAVATVLVGAGLYAGLLTVRRRPPLPEPPDFPATAAASVDAVSVKAAELIADVETRRDAAVGARERLHELAEERIRSLEGERLAAARAWRTFREELDARDRAGMRAQWMFFGLGVLASIPVGIAINLLTS